MEFTFTTSLVTVSSVENATENMKTKFVTYKIVRSRNAASDTQKSVDILKLINTASSMNFADTVILKII